MPRVARTAIFIILIALAAGLNASAAALPNWHAYTYRDGAFLPLPMAKGPNGPMGTATALQICRLADWPPSWHLLAALHSDLTHDGAPECVLLVWRPWQDWPIMQWSDTPSPIAAHRDARGDSAHVILIEPSEYRELWAGSALATPIIQIAAGDVDGDGRNELVALEGDYASGRYGPARHVAVWSWNGFGFTLGWRGPPAHLVALTLADLDGDGAAEILVR